MAKPYKPQTDASTPCAWPECREHGQYPAPRDPRNLSARQYFCAGHIKEFNKRWNGLEGYTVDDIYKLQHGAATWNRPTWGMGVNGAKVEAAANPFARAQDLFEFFQNRIATEGKSKGAAPVSLLPADVKEACVIFNIEQPLEETGLKKRYLTLVKQHHPDVNKTSTAEEQLKRINVAYKILTDYAARR
jgi:hypothetical protein